jgi:hypothetical protein
LISIAVGETTTEATSAARSGAGRSAKQAVRRRRVMDEASKIKAEEFLAG